MKFCRFVILTAALLTTQVLPLSAQLPAADEASTAFFEGYMMVNDADKLEREGNYSGALGLFQKMQQIFDSVSQTYPNWQPGMVAHRRGLTEQAISRVTARLTQPTMAPAPAPAAASPAPAPVMSSAPAPVASFPAAGGSIPTPGTLAGPAGGGPLPSLSDTLAQWEQAYRQRVRELEAQNSVMQQDLGKWQQWYQWASGEITKARADKDALAQKSADLEKAITTMRAEVAAGRAAASELDALVKQKVAIEIEYKKVVQKLAAAESAAKEGSQKLVEASDRIATVEAERNGLLAERDKAVKERDAANKERDKLSAQNLGMKTELEDLRKMKPGGGDAEVKRLLAQIDRLKLDKEAAEKQLATMKTDATRKDSEIAELRGQVSKMQAEIVALRKDSGTYQTQVAELKLRLKNLQMGNPDTMPPELVEENTTLREIIMRQLRSQYRQQQAKDLVLAELQKMEGVSKDLLTQVEELSASRLTLTTEEEKLFTDPAVREMLGGEGIQGTLIAKIPKPGDAASVKGSPATAAAAPVNPVNAILAKANETFSAQRFSEAAALYEEALRAEPKNTTALVGLGYSRQRENKLDAAEAALKKCLTFDPNHDAAAFHLGVTHFKQQRWNDSLAAFEKSLGKNPQNARARHYLGIIATKLNFMDRAEREFKTALSIDPNYGEAHFNLAVLYATWNPPQWDKAQTEYDAAVKKGVSPDEALEKLLKGSKGAAKSVSAR